MARCKRTSVSSETRKTVPTQPRMNNKRRTNTRSKNDIDGRHPTSKSGVSETQSTVIVTDYGRDVSSAAFVRHHLLLGHTIVRCTPTSPSNKEAIERHFQNLSAIPAIPGSNQNRDNEDS